MFPHDRGTEWLPGEQREEVGRVKEGWKREGTSGQFNFKVHSLICRLYENKGVHPPPCTSTLKSSVSSPKISEGLVQWSDLTLWEPPSTVKKREVTRCLLTPARSRHTSCTLSFLTSSWCRTTLQSCQTAQSKEKMLVPVRFALFVLPWQAREGKSKPVLHTCTWISGKRCFKAWRKKWTQEVTIQNKFSGSCFGIWWRLCKPADFPLKWNH